MRNAAFLLSLCLLIAFGGFSAAHAAKRVALVIGNADYKNTAPLSNPANDADDMTAALERLGFTVISERNLTKAGMDTAFRRFALAIDGADAALFFYAGHGMQFQGINYLMPVDAKLEHEAELPYEMAQLDSVLADMARVKGVRIAVLDACRNNPLEQKLKRKLARTRGISPTRGFARLKRTEGLLVAFATQTGDVAEDGDGRNSPFTTALLQHIELPGLEVGPLFRRVASDVNGTTGGKQTPELSISLLGEFYFAGRVEIHPGNTSSARKSPPSAPVSVALEAWREIRNTKRETDLEAFIKRFPKSFYAELARTRLEELRESIDKANAAPERPQSNKKIRPPTTALPVPPSKTESGGKTIDQIPFLWVNMPNGRQCSARCTHESGCVGWRYEDGRECVLYRSEVKRSFNQDNTLGASPQRAKRPTPTFPTKPVEPMSGGKTIGQRPFIWTNTPNGQRCSARCARETGCIGWEYKDSNECVLYRSEVRARRQ